MGRWLVLWVLRPVVAFAAVFAVLYLLALWALRDLDRAVAEGRGGDGLNGVQSGALFIVSQVAPLRQPGADGVTSGRVFRDCPVCPEMVEIPAGIYLMGSPWFEEGRYEHIWARRPYRKQLQFVNREGPRRLVTIAGPLAMMRYELTRAEWLAAQAQPDWPEVTGRPAKAPGYGDDAEPDSAVTGIDWYDAQAYARWLSARSGQTYRLPTEAEWEYAARAGTTTAYPWGDEIGTDNAACADCSTIWTEARVGPVGLHPANAFGLHDMNGNAWEWTEDCYADTLDPIKSTGAAYRFEGCELVAFRGGTAFAEPWQARSAMRVGPHPDNAGEGSTIRLVRDLDGG